ncbi:2-hydroxychromene-2-carboxylate isomerase [Caldimonas thermodepolymerans]|jgi:2-hydroxychromene-2-carboxylate isomerase|uniref:2-hydroxychromene-2-carboxylate isomerase n=1 Tax=Caldimonas thermodepolymerans TaxID=215580 RepID=A0AA46HW60_9BURK|nr:2-hydroxychromene-2-carboxylate isomerase [Caldimonas thermodepolymerans]TCP07994.1 2-hydroxychromene-2-carboxylate isomerase [Caldimonas thermodepolymerans]UZG48880.1 2-hydroxychromene-2-carboxylate isomerase [Caldimonas thermodepolymerans]
MTPRPVLEFWFDFGSNYSYLAAMRIDRLAARAGVQVAWKPFLLGPVFRALGWPSSPSVVQREKGRYVWRDMEREAARLGLPFRRPSRFPRAALLAHRVAVAADGQPWLPEFCQALFLRNFAADQDIEDMEAVSEVLSAVGQHSGVWIERAQQEDVKLRLRRQTEEAQARGIFGAPTFFVADEMFWGNDRLEQALAWATGEAGRPER